MRMRTTLAAASGLFLTDARSDDKPASDSTSRLSGFPTAEAAKKARDDGDFQRAVTAYRFWYPTVSCEGIFNGNREKGIKDNESLIILSAGPRQVVFTANS